ncbi:MAG TPA: hypothetical protein VLC74_08260 [Rhizomicrobium sp.]|nr:hypothetical protein [Rhizomicrobium sp.]
MEKVRQFRQRATECRVAAARASTAEIRSRYEDMAYIWEKLADERLDFFVQKDARGSFRARRSSSR